MDILLWILRKPWLVGIIVAIIFFSAYVKYATFKDMFPDATVMQYLFHKEMFRKV